MELGMRVDKKLKELDPWIINRVKFIFKFKTVLMDLEDAIQLGRKAVFNNLIKNKDCNKSYLNRAIEWEINNEVRRTKDEQQVYLEDFRDSDGSTFEISEMGYLENFYERDINTLLDNFKNTELTQKEVFLFDEILIKDRKLKEVALQLNLSDSRICHSVKNIKSKLKKYFIFNKIENAS